MQFNRTFGVHSNLKRGMLLYRHISLFDAFTVMIAGMVIIGAQKVVFNPGTHDARWPEILFNVCVILLTAYSLIHPRSNPHKRNIDLLMMSFLPTVRYFQSIPNYQTYHRMHGILLDKMPLKRTPVDKAMLYKMPSNHDVDSR